MNHTFKPGHRIMVQVQSRWFPLYDRNPDAYRPATHRIHVSKELPSRLEVRVQ